MGDLEEADYLTEAEIGTRYKVTWSDCCAAGSFEAALVRRNYVHIDGYEPYVNSLTFDNGVTIGGCKVELTAVTAS